MSMDYFSISEKDKEILRKLATRQAEIAAQPVQSEKKELWYKHNALEVTRPLIVCDPENGWKEIITDKDLQCEGDLARTWEIAIRREIFSGAEMKDDKVIEALFEVALVHSDNGMGINAIFESRGGGGAYHWDAPLKDYKDLDKLHFREISVDTEKSTKVMALAQEVFDGILSVRLNTKWWWTLGMTQTLVFIRGLEQMMFDMYDYPDELHQLMAFFRDEHLNFISVLEKNNWLSPNNDGTHVGSGGYGWSRALPQKDFDGIHLRTKDMWGFGESQETSEVSPDMFEEFIFPYQLPILEKFGLNCYGCCEPLDARWHVIKRIPNLRRVSVSAWANKAAMAEMLGGNYVYSMKPMPTPLAYANIDEDAVRKELKEARAVTRDCRLELIMKDNNTIGNNPQNVIRWVEIAREETQK